MAWLEAADELELFTSALTIGELRRGVALLPEGARRERFAASLRELVHWLGDRIVPVTQEVALAWGDISAQQWRRGRKTSMTDQLIASTALVHDFTVVTRNTTDFEASGCRLLCPWSS